MAHIYLYTILILLSIENLLCLEREITVNVQARKEDCFYQPVKVGDIIDIEYQVIDGGHGDLDITFHLVDPTGRILVADYKKTENNHRMDARFNGDYRFCFDNTFSSYNSKTVFFELIIENNSGEEDDDNSNEWTGDIDGLRPEDVYEMRVQDIQDVMNNVRNQLSKVRLIQDILKSIEARDRNIAEENYFKVNTFSLIQICIMMIVGFIQVVMVKSLFDDHSRVRKIWRNFNHR